jgi:hypothetical protein
MKRCWLHIGMHKTGSTSIQRNLGNVENPEGWHLLKVGKSSNTGPSMHAMFDPNHEKCFWFIRSGLNHRQIEEYGIACRSELLTNIKNFKEGEFIISGESMSNFNRQCLSEIKIFLAPLFDEVRVIGYIRPPLSYRNSWFQQKLKGSNYQFGTYKTKLNYREKFAKFDEIFGKSNVILKRFQPADFRNRCVVTDFCQELGIDLPASVSLGRANESLSREACGMLHAYRQLGPGYGNGKNALRENRDLIRVFQQMGGAKFKLSNSLILACVDLDQEDRQWAEMRLGMPLDDYSVEDGSEVASEADLLRIRRSTCENFAKSFHEIYDITIPKAVIPKDDQADPAQVAFLIEFARQLIKKRNQNIDKTRYRKRLVRRIKRMPIVATRLVFQVLGINVKF